MQKHFINNKIYFSVLAAMILVYILLAKFCFPHPKFIIIGAVPLVIYIICKDIFTGLGWFAKPKPPKPVNTFKQDIKIAIPISDNEKHGYLQLMHLLVNPALQPVLEPFIYELKTFDSTNEENTPLYSLATFADENNIPFIMGLSIRSAIEDLEWRIQTALKTNYGIAIVLPSPNSWQAHASVSFEGVFKTYNDALQEHGFQLGFIYTSSAEYMIIIFRSAQKDNVIDAVGLIGYTYQDVD